jgi:secreted PhoX family phosphatase
MTLTRRDLFKRSAITGAGLVVVGNLDTLFGASPAAAAPAAGAGPVVADPAGILDLPEGFKYQVLTRAGDPLVGHAGVVPGRPDSMGTFASGRGTVIVQNHEQSATGAPDAVAAADRTYDPAAKGGTTTLRVTGDNRVVEEWVSLAGTSSNCSGGITPWGTWLTCEETEQKATGGYSKSHGWVFEVDPQDDANNRNPTPLAGLGRFPHEAAIVDPDLGQVYLTEDASSPNGLLYRFTPNRRPRAYGDLRGAGTLEAMCVPGVTDLSTFTEPGTTLQVTWKAVPDPAAAAVSTRKQFTYRNVATGAVISGPGGEITRSKKFEGLWWADGRAHVVCSFAHGAADWSDGSHDGQVWSYDPRTSTLRLEVRFAPASDPDTQPDGPDNITVSPFGGYFLAEDGAGTQHLLVVGADGETAFFARNAVSGSEFTGVVFSPDQKTLFANIQDDGLTLAITGPFARFHRTRNRNH